MTRKVCRYCGKPQTTGERYCCPSCRYADRGIVGGESWEEVTKSAAPLDGRDR